MPSIEVSNSLSNQLKMYIENQNTLLAEHEGKIIAVQNGKCVGEYEDDIDAYRDMIKRGYKEGDFAIYLCTKGDSAYTAYMPNLYIKHTD